MPMYSCMRAGRGEVGGGGWAGRLVVGSPGGHSSLAPCQLLAPRNRGLGMGVRMNQNGSVDKSEWECG